MILLHSVASKFCARFGRQYTPLKSYHTLCFASYRIIHRESIFAINRNKKINKNIYSSAIFYDKSEVDSRSAPDKLNEIVKDKHNTLKEKTLGDIIVKTETDADNVVTKVTIEKAKPKGIEENVNQVIAPPSMDIFLIKVLFTDFAILFHTNLNFQRKRGY